MDSLNRYSIGISTVSNRVPPIDYRFSVSCLGAPTEESKRKLLVLPTPAALKQAANSTGPTVG
jgi:hypothetical protein